MSYSIIYENLAVKIQCKNEEGSGVLFKVPSQEYTYIFTAKHCLQGIDVNPQQFDVSDIIVSRLEDGEWIQFEVIDFKLHEKADIALIIIKHVSNLEKISLAEKSYREDVTIYGFPEHAKTRDNPPESFDATLTNEQRNIIELKTQHELATFYQGGDTYLTGFSGSGIFIETFDRNLALIGVFTEIKDRQLAYRSLIGESIEQFNDILKDTEYSSLPILRPDFMVKKIFKESRYINEWQQEKRLNSTDWLESERARLIIHDIQNHFLRTDEINILHLVGRSGIGKTRTTLQACVENEELSNVLYFNNYTSFIESVDSYYFNPDKKYQFVIDDINMNEWEYLNNKFTSSNIRIITLGVVPEHKMNSREGIRIIEQPRNQDIIELIQNINPTIDDLGCQRILSLSDKDLRLLMLLLETYKREQALSTMKNVADRFGSMESTLDRIFNQFSSELGNVNNFKQYYSKLCLLVDIGIAGEYKDEIIYLSQYFGLNQQEMDVFIEKANRCWLGVIKNEFFEPLPRALSRYLFETESWPYVKRNLNNFINGMPTYQMKKRFINRIEECNDEFRKEAESELSAWFREAFPREDLELLDNIENAKVFKVFTEFSPNLGLSWLRMTLKNANYKQLMNFKGSSGIFGANKERRYIVWLCEHLACFKEYFWACEDILFILAQHETEEHISNNSRGVWTGLFTPILSNVETTFEGRYNLLIQRLRESTQTNIEIILEAFKPVFTDRQFKMVPPKTIGGRIVPMEWRPANHKELQDIRVHAIDRLINSIKFMNSNIQIKAFEFLIADIRLFINYGFLDELVDLFENVNIYEEINVILKNALQEAIHSSEKYNHYIDRETSVKEWLDKLSDSSFDSKMKDYILGDYWSLYRTKGETFIEEDINNLAIEIITNNIDINYYLSINEDNQKNSVFLQRLMGKIGFLDMDNLYKSYIDNLIKENKMVPLVVAYLKGIISRGKLSNHYKSMLNAHEEKFPESILAITINCEVDNVGFNRILSIIKKDDSLVKDLLPMQYSEWGKMLTEIEQFELFETIKECSTNHLSRYTILSLINGWYRTNKREKLSDQMSLLLIEILFECLIEDSYKFDDWEWQEVFKIIPTGLDEHKITLLIEVLTSRKLGHSNLEDFVVFNLKKYAQEGYSENVMSKLGTAMLNNKTNFSFYLHVFRGLFESIDYEVVKGWVENNGIDAARAIARHIASPYPKENDKSYVPQLTEWLLSTYEWDDRLFREFIAGRHSLEVINISEAIKNHEVLVQEMEPYLSHSLNRVREWAEYEIKQSENLRKDEEIRRTREEREY
ncbi:hypothetical protein [Alkalicoccobacillus gibsonii]|uniref:hypothetical protein n=1 Tax=Alkalicoccobacillus gibsonii TaxID=79881 RepID=UPI003519CADE